VTRRVEVLVPTEAALVLGSTQPDDGVDAGGLAVVRRRSGGGAVLVAPDDPLWVDVDLPVGDPHWDDDVGRSFLWLGDAWARALADHGIPAEVHRGGFGAGRWGRTVCFAGRGPGEVFVRGAKVVGLAQRRTRAGARFQCAVLRRWDPTALVDALVAPAQRAAARAELATAARGVEVDPDALVEGLLRHLAEG
jgi:lipoate-protein ligase A